jgi:hypothetical protein
VDVGQIRIIFWDLGGQAELRELWEKVGFQATELVFATPLFCSTPILCCFFNAVL